MLAYEKARSGSARVERSEMKQYAMQRRAGAILAAIGCLFSFPLAARADTTTNPTPARAHARTELEHIGWATLQVLAVEKRLDQWRPTKENERVPHASARSPQTDVSGEWKVYGGYEGSSFVITRSGLETYAVVFETYGCMGWWKLRRTAHYSRGMLVLNRPVQEYSSLPYQKIYAVRVGVMEYLLPDVAVGRFEQGFWPDGSFTFSGRDDVFFRTTPIAETPKPPLAPPRPGETQ
jgi:hypothetical protein